MMLDSRLRTGSHPVLCLLAATWALLAGCAHQRPAPAPLNVQEVHRFAARGYPGNGPLAVQTTQETWTPTNGAPVTLVWSVPTSAGTHPLVVYLPGLGEAAQAGARWREAWAHAGYAVVAVQLLAADAQAHAPTDARGDTHRAGGYNDNFDPRAKERFAPDLMRQRLTALHDLLRDATTRSQQGDPLMRRVDLTRVAVAGFDLGAYVAMAQAGERVPGIQPTSDVPQPRAYIALSPYANFADSGFDTRYLAVRAPVLSITSNADVDPTGLVGSSYLRSAPFNGMPAGDKYLLMLHDSAHTVLAGNNVSANTPNDLPEDMGDMPADRSSAGGGDPTSRNGRRGGGGSARGSMGGGAGGPPGGMDGTGSGRVQQSPTARAMSQVAIEDVSLAFLDTYLRDDPIGREWLTRDGPRWLIGHADLRVK